MTLALLLAMLAFMCWAVWHEHVAQGWREDELIGGELSALLRADPDHVRKCTLCAAELRGDESHLVPDWNARTGWRHA